MPESIGQESGISKRIQHKVISTLAKPYLDILQKTKGSWRKEKDIAAHQEKLGLEASAKRKQAW